MDNLYIQHLDKAKQLLAASNNCAPYVFAMACVERLWIPYQQASQDAPDDTQAVYRMSLDLAWESLAGGKELSDETETVCERSIPDTNRPMIWLTRAAAVSFYSVICIIRRKKSGECFSVAKANLNLLDHFIYELTGLVISRGNDLLVVEHELMKNEMRHQTEDLELLRQQTSVSLIHDIRQRSNGKSIFGNYPLTR